MSAPIYVETICCDNVMRYTGEKEYNILLRFLFYKKVMLLLKY